MARTVAMEKAKAMAAAKESAGNILTLVNRVDAMAWLATSTQLLFGDELVITSIIIDMSQLYLDNPSRRRNVFCLFLLQIITIICVI